MEGPGLPVAATNGGPGAGGERPVARARRIPWARVLALAALVGLTVLAANSCQQSQIRVDQQRAVAIARDQVDFRPRSQQIRLVRQGLSSHPLWAVSLSVPAKDGRGYARLAVVRVDANTGAVVAVATQRPGARER